MRIGSITATIQFAEFKMINKYELGQSAVLTARTTIENTGASNLTNVRIWVGTRDDYVCGSDVVNKQRGTFEQLEEGSTNFVVASGNTAESTAVKIESSSPVIIQKINCNSNKKI